MVKRFSKKIHLSNFRKKKTGFQISIFIRNQFKRKAITSIGISLNVCRSILWSLVLFGFICSDIDKSFKLLYLLNCVISSSLQWKKPFNRNVIRAFKRIWHLLGLCFKFKILKFIKIGISLHNVRCDHTKQTIAGVFINFLNGKHFSYLIILQFVKLTNTPAGMHTTKNKKTKSKIDEKWF